MSASYDGFWKICDDNGVCHCDWRLTVYGCEEEQHMVPFYIALAAFSGLVGTMGKCLCINSNNNNNNTSSSKILIHAILQLPSSVTIASSSWIKPYSIVVLVFLGPSRSNRWSSLVQRLTYVSDIAFGASCTWTHFEWLVRMIHAIIMVTDVAPNVAFRSCMCLRKKAIQIVIDTPLVVVL